MGHEARDTAGVTTRLIVSYIRRRHGDGGVARLLELAGESRPVSLLEDERSWSSYRQKIALFDAAEALTGDPMIARRIGECVLEEQLAAPIRLVIGALGTPQQVLRSVAKANVKFSTNSQMRCLESRPGRGVVTYRVVDGYAPERHDCNYTKGVLSQVTALFGLPTAHVDETTCQVEGADECTLVVTWPHRRWRRPRHDGSLIRDAELDVLRQQVVDLQTTVGEVVASDDLDQVLTRVAARASAAVRGQRFLLAVRLDDERDVRIHHDGFDEDAAAALGAGLLADPIEGAAAGPDVLVVEVASASRRYGRLAAFLPPGTGFLPAERTHLEAYARLAAAALDAATALAAARRSATVAEALLTCAHGLAQTSRVPDIARLVVEAVPSVVGATSASMRLWHEDEQVLRTVAVHGLPPDLAARAWRLELTPGRVRDLMGMVEDPRPRRYGRDDPDPYVRQQLTVFGHDTVAVVPIVVQGSFAGVIFANWGPHDPRPVDDQLFRGMAGLSDQAALALANARSLERARHQATHDALTGLANRVLFHEHLSSAVAGAQRSGSPAAVCYLDLDGFKQVNDTRGHAAGDAVLVEVARRLREVVRASDEVARLAGDEFAVLLRDVTGPEEAAAVASKLVGAVGQPVRLEDGDHVRLTGSVGIALAPSHGETPDELLRAADVAMYEAKAHGDTYRIRAEAARS